MFMQNIEINIYLKELTSHQIVVLEVSKTFCRILRGISTIMDATTAVKDVCFTNILKFCTTN